MKDKIVIVGGAGFIGHNLAIELKRRNFNVSIIDSLEVNNLYSLKGNINKLPYPKLAKKILKERFKLLKQNKIDLKIIDARNYNSLCKTLNYLKPKKIIHLAAVSHSDRSNKDPHSTFDHSLRTLENTLDYSKNRVNQFLFLSSSMVYGNFKKKVVNENDICNPIGIYGALKYSAEKIIQAYGQVFNLPYTIIRPSALYGERCISRRVGQIFIESALNNKEIIIQGDGKDKLDFTYIQDLVQGICCALTNKNALGEIFNITCGNAKPINELLKYIKINFPNVNVKYVKRDKLMPKRGTLSTSKAKKLIKYKSNWKLDKGYPEYINWYKNLYNSK